MGLFSWMFNNKKDNSIVVDFLNKRVSITGKFKLKRIYDEIKSQCNRNKESFDFCHLLADDEDYVTLELSRGWTFNDMAVEFLKKKERNYHKEVSGDSTYLTVKFKNSRE